jgi:hypothetical protein
LFELKGRVSSLIGDLERLGSYVHIEAVSSPRPRLRSKDEYED